MSLIPEQNVILKPLVALDIAPRITLTLFLLKQTLQSNTQKLTIVNSCLMTYNIRANSALSSSLRARFA